MSSEVIFTLGFVVGALIGILLGVFTMACFIVGRDKE